MSETLTAEYSPEFLTSQPANVRVDRKAGAAGGIIGAKAIQLGELSEGDSRPFYVDRATLEQVVEMVNAPAHGLKMRFSHQSGLDQFLGRATNARIIEDGDDSYVAIDPMMSRAATKTPSGNLADYVLTLAEDTPEDFGLSVAGTRLDIDAMKAAKGEDGKMPIRFKGLRAIDFAGDPAATRGGLFEINDEAPVTFEDHAEWFIETHLSDQTQDAVTAKFAEFTSTYFAPEGPAMSEEQDPRDERIAELEAKVAELETPDTPETPEPDTVNLEADEARKTLKRRAELTALCTLAKIDDATRDLMITANFDRAEAQDFLKSSGLLSANNPPISEGGTDLGEKKDTPEAKFGAEFDEFADVYTRQGITREDFITSRMNEQN